VTQKAVSGDLIRVIKAFDEPYSVGDIMEVDMRQSDMGACDDDMLMTTEGYVLQDGEYVIFKAKEKIVLSITDKQIEEVNQLYKRACQIQSNSPYDLYDATEIQAIQAVCEILNIKLD
jgi:hypothetical protein